MHSPSQDVTPLGYRPCVGIMLLNAENLVWMGRRADGQGNPEGPGAWWQMPQGGIDEGEDPATAVLRELREETGIRNAHILAEAPGWFTYDLPPQLVGVAWGGRYRGQRQKWFALRFTGADSEIDIVPPPPHTVEFDAWRWVPMIEVVDLVVPFKRDVYQDVMRVFAPLVGSGV